MKVLKEDKYCHDYKHRLTFSRKYIFLNVYFQEKITENWLKKGDQRHNMVSMQSNKRKVTNKNLKGIEDEIEIKCITAIKAIGIKQIQP